MSSVFVTLGPDSDLELLESYAQVPFGGEYFFLYPAILELQKETGELIDPQSSAFFAGPRLEALSRFVDAARRQASGQPDTWAQRVGRAASTGEPIQMTTSRGAVLALLDQLSAAIGVARQSGYGVLVTEE